MGVFGMFAVMQGRRPFSSVFAITERRDMVLYEVPLSVSLLGFGIGTMLSTSMCEVFFVGKSSFIASPRGPMCFRCLIFSLSGPYELLLLLCFIASWT